MMMLPRKKEKGFTLIEVMLVVIIIGIIAIIALPKLLVTRDTARDKSCDSNLQALRTATEQYKWDFVDPVSGVSGIYPPGTDVPDLVGELMDPDGGGVEEPYLPQDSSISSSCPDPDGILTYDDGNGSIECDIHTTVGTGG